MNFILNVPINKITAGLIYIFTLIATTPKLDFETDKMDITGTWTKTSVSECSSVYPDTITFKPNGIYHATVAPNAKNHPIWDAGTFKTDDNDIKISTSNDAVINYKMALKNKEITFTAPDGCDVEFKKVAE